MKVHALHVRETPGSHEPPVCLSQTVKRRVPFPERRMLMKTGELLKLITLGYKPADLKELSELSKDKPEALQIALSGSNLSDVKDYLSLISDEESAGQTPAPEPEKPKTPESEETPDYKSMYEELKKKSDAQQEKIKEIQTNNQRQDQSGKQPSDDDILKDIVASFM